MNVAIRYYSRSGNTKALAEAISDITNVDAISVDNPNAKIDKTVDILFIGGALYAYGLDKNLKEYLSKLDNEHIKRAIVFSTSWISKHSIDLIKKALKEKNIIVEEEYIYAKGKPSEEEIKEAKKIVSKYI